MQKPRVTLDDIWPDLEKGMNSVLTNINAGFPSKQWMLLYTSVYDYCTSSKPPASRPKGVASSSGACFVGEDLYNKVKTYLTKFVKSLLKEADSKMEEDLLSFYYSQWKSFTTAMKHLNHIYQYLNRHWIKREADDGKKEVYEIFPLSLVTWREHFFFQIRTRLTKALLIMIERERNHFEVETTLIRGVIDSYTSLGLNREKPSETTLDIYKQYFQNDFLLGTEVYYALQSNHFISTNSVADYMKTVEVWLAEESRRCHQYLPVSTEPDLIRNCEKVLIEKHVETIWAEFQHLLNDDKTDDLARMFTLLHRVHKLDPLKTIFESHIQNVGFQAIEQTEKEMANSPNDSTLYVESILKVYKKYNLLVVNSFRSDPGFVASLDKACKRFINDNAVCKAAKSAAKSPELLAKFCDNLLKKTAKMPEESEMERMLTDVMVIFKYIEDKDVFQTFYSKQLAKRLIHGTSASEDLESHMISKLKSTCGYEYTSKLQRMFTDMGLNKDLNEKFQQFLANKSSLISDPIDFNVLVLATGSWPLQPPSATFILPRELQAYEELFQKFYCSQYSGRKLDWLHQLSKGEVKARIGQKIYTFQCSTYQMGVLVLFNKCEAMTFLEIQNATQLHQIPLTTTLLSLLRTKVLLVDQSEEEKTFEKNTKFSVNDGFKNKRNRVNVNVPVTQEERKQTDDVNKAVEEDRKLQIQAAIVRIMKMRKKLHHNYLITEVHEQLQSRFKPRVPMIKKCIDILIEKEYLERAEEGKDLYTYVA